MLDHAGEPSTQLILRNLSDPAAPVVFLQHGVTIGRYSGSSVRVDSPDVLGVHAQVEGDHAGNLKLKANSPTGIQLAEHGVTWDLALRPGVSFVIGKTVFAVDESVAEIPDIRSPRDEGRAMRAEPPVTPESLGLACGTCQRIVATLPVPARYCPRCGAMLPENRPDLTFLADLASRNSRRGLFSWLLPVARADPNWRLLGRRPGTLIAYVNSIVNLARRYQGGSDRNVDQALRYYAKAARLGSGVARRELAAAGVVSTPKDVLPYHSNSQS